MKNSLTAVTCRLGDIQFGLLCRSSLLVRRSAFIIAFLLLLSCGRILAQGPGPGGTGEPLTTDNRFTTSIRPVIVGVEFEGNDELNDGLILARIQTKPTQPTFIQRFFETFARISDIKVLAWLYTDRYRAEMHRILDSISGEVRYLNPTSVAADTLKIRDLYQDNGFHDARVGFSISVDTSRNTAVVHFLINEGVRYPLRGVHYLGLGEVPDDVMEKIETPQLLTLGEPYNKDQLTAERDRVIQVLKNNGYAFASPNLISVFQLRGSGPGMPYDSALVSIYPGDRYRFGRTVHVDDSTVRGRRVDSSTIFQQVDYSEGDWYSEQLVEQTVSNLYGLGTFDVVRVDTATELSHGDTLGMRLSTRLRPLHEYLVAPEFSYERRGTESALYAGVSGSVNVLNVRGGAERLGVSGRVQSRIGNWGELTYGLSGSFFKPSNPWATPFLPFKGNGSHLSWLISPGYDYAVEDRITKATISEDVVLRSQRWSVILSEFSYRFPKYTFINLVTLRLFAQRTKYLGVDAYIDQQALTRIESLSDCPEATTLPSVRDALRSSIYRVQVLQGDNLDLVTDPEERADFDQLKYSEQFSISATADHRNDFFSPTDGQFADLRLEGGGTGLIFNGFTGGFAKVNFDYRSYLPAGGHSSWALRSHIGWIFEFGRLPLTPISSRFTAGGAYSLRGWDSRSMLVTSPPTQALGNDCAGQILKDILNESRRLLGGLGLIELMGEYRWNPFNLPPTSTVKRQINNIGFIFFLDAGNAYFRDYKQDSALLGSFGNALKTIVTNIGISVGASIGYNTPVGPFRVGFGYPIYDPVNLDRQGAERWAWGRPFNINDFVLHIALGHAF